MRVEQHEPRSYRIAVRWPTTTHAESKVANLFTFVDDGSHVYFAFGFVPPAPTDVPPPETMEIPPVGSFQLDRSLIFNLRESLTAYIERNPQWFDQARVNTDPAKEASDDNSD